mgnify:CR=1 FL=1
MKARFGNLGYMFPVFLRRYIYRMKKQRKKLGFPRPEEPSVKTPGSEQLTASVSQLEPTALAVRAVGKAPPENHEV